MIGLSFNLIMADCCQLSKFSVLESFGNVNGLDAETWAMRDGSMLDDGLVDCPCGGGACG